MRRRRILNGLLAAALVTGLPGLALAQSGSGPYLGLDLGVSEPVNDNYRAHVHTGASASPYAGYMLNDVIGLQGNLQFMWQPPDNDHRGFKHENQDTTVFGAIAGPRIDIPIVDFFRLYVIGQGGVYTGLSGRINNTNGGFSVGGGADWYLTENVALTAFGRYNKMYIAPQPTFLGPPVTGPPPQAADEQGPSDAQFVTAGIGFKYDFRTKEAPPPPPPPPVAKAPAPPAPPVKRKIVLRAVHFDFDKSNIRADAVPILNEAVKVLTEETKDPVVVEGHTDSVGTDAYNMKLSLRRADAVKKYLATHGVPGSRISAEGFGEANPVATNETEEGRAQNRRVELKLK